MLRNKFYLYGDENLQVPAHLHFGKEMFDRMLQYKDNIALINSDTGEKVTYGELAQQTASVALSLARIGIRKGDVVSICSEKRFEFMPSLLGILCAGAIFSSFDVSYGDAQLLHRLSLAKSKLIFCSLKAYEAHKQALDSAGTINTYVLYGNEAREGAILFSDFATECSSWEDFLPIPVNGWDDRVSITFSSGTTGLPKGVPMTHLNYLANTIILAGGQFAGMRVLNTREWYYNYGCMISLNCLRDGTTIIFSQRNQPTDWLSAISDYKIQMLQLTPSTIIDMIKIQNLHEYDLSSVEYIISSSTPMLADQVKLVREKIPTLIDIISLYGMSEAGCICSSLKNAGKIRPGSSGPPFPGFICKVVDMQTREPLGPNQRGEICYKSPSLIKEYVGYDLTKDIDEEGFFKSGDLGYYDEEGNIFIVDRIKELMKFKDIAVAPEELEVILLQHEAVREVGVVGVPHKEYGQAPLAFVVLQPNATATAEELIDFLHDRVTYRMRLAGGVRFVEKLPRGAGAKLDRKALKQMI